MLEAVQAVHRENVVHTDLKPANFVLVKGRLKIIDFGIAKAIANDTVNIQRDQQVSIDYGPSRLRSTDWHCKLHVTRGYSKNEQSEGIEGGYYSRHCEDRFILIVLSYPILAMFGHLVVSFTK